MGWFIRYVTNDLILLNLFPEPCFITLMCIASNRCFNFNPSMSKWFHISNKRDHWGPFYKQGLHVCHVPSKVRDYIIYPLPNFNGATEIWEWLSNRISYFITDVQTWTKVLGLFFQSPKPMCNLIWNSLILSLWYSTSTQVFLFWIWLVYAVVLYISGPFRDVTYFL